MNIAILLGVSEYSDASNNLPGCVNDMEVIYQILNNSGKYEEILVLQGRKNSDEVKEIIIGFIEKFKDSSITEVFFYFTGHGLFFDDEFHYILSDYEKNKLKQTSLHNQVLDTWLKSLHADLIIKVVDACQSGIMYIKKPDNESVSKYFKDTHSGFKKCYFMYSSLNSQYSYQNKFISDFTLEFANSLKKEVGTKVRYTNVMDYISDQFAVNERQTPFFIMQADCTEVFCVVDSNMTQFLETDFPRITKGEKTEEKLITTEANQIIQENEDPVINQLKKRAIEIKGYRKYDEADEELDRIAAFIGRKYVYVELMLTLIKSNINRGSGFVCDMKNSSQEQINYSKQLCDSLLNIAFLESSEYRNRIFRVKPFQLSKAIEFLTGEWFERYIKAEALEILSSKFPNLTFKYIQKPKVLFADNTEFDLDILFDVEGNFFWFETRTGAYQNYLAKYIKINKLMQVDEKRAFFILPNISDKTTEVMKKIHKINVINIDKFASCFSTELLQIEELKGHAENGDDSLETSPEN